MLSAFIHPRFYEDPAADPVRSILNWPNAVLSDSAKASGSMYFELWAARLQVRVQLPNPCRGRMDKDDAPFCGSNRLLCDCHNTHFGISTQKKTREIESQLCRGACHSQPAHLACRPEVP